MNCKFTLLCIKCGCKMEISSPIKFQADQIACQNCCQILAKDEKNKIFNLFSYVMQFENNALKAKKNPYESDPGFQFEIDIF